MTGAVPLRSGHRPDVEGLRAVAVLLVIAFHAGVGFLSGGFVGVDVFFVLSGFLITGLLADELLRTGSLSFTRFYGRRARRLLPMSTLVLVVVAVAFVFVLPPLDRPSLVGDIRASALYVANWHFGLHSLDYMSSVNKSPVLHYWTLSVEEQFYLIWPVILLLVARRGRRLRRNPVGAMALALGGLGAASLLASAVLTSPSSVYSYYGLHTRAWELAAGGLLALGSQHLSRLPHALRALGGWLGLAGIVASAVVIGPGTRFPGVAALLPVLSTVLVVAAGGPGIRRGVGAVLSARPLTYVGRISYSWYLWHWPCLVFAAAAAGGLAAGDEGDVVTSPARGWLAVAAVVVSFALSVASYHVLENPVRRSRWLAALRHRSLVLGASLTTGVAAVAGVLLPVGSAASAGTVTAYTVRVPPLMQATSTTTAPPVPSRSATPTRLRLKESPAQARDDAPPDLRDCVDDRAHDGIGTDCRYGDPDGKMRVALIGDSHAKEWQEALATIAKKKHWTLYFWAKLGCPMVDLTINLDRLGGSGDYTSCTTWRDRLVQRLRASGPYDAIIVGRYSKYLRHVRLPGSDEPLGADEAVQAWGDSWAAMSTTLHEFARNVVLFEDNPKSPRDVPDCIAGHSKDIRPCSFPRGPALHDSHQLYAAEHAAASQTTEFVDVNDFLCPGDLCPVVWSDGTIMYKDQHHLTASLTMRVVPIIKARLVPLVEHGKGT